jgi:hypothetical protein
MDTEAEFIRHVLGPAAVSAIRRIDATRKARLPVPKEEWAGLVRALTARLDQDTLDSPVGRAVITELLRRATYAKERYLLPSPARCGLEGSV